MLCYALSIKGREGCEMEDILKIKKAANALFATVSIVLLWFIVQTVRGFLLNTAEWYAVGVVSFSVGVLILTTILLFALALLYTIRRDGTPFQRKNVTRLKTIGVLLVALEPYMLFAQWVSNRLYPIILSDGARIETHSSMGGTIIAAGLVVYCVSLVFDYGISLQRQVDETL